MNRPAMSHFRRTCIILAMAGVLSHPAVAQEEEYQRRAEEFQARPGLSPVHSDLVNLPSPDSLGSRLLVLVDIPGNFFVFIKTGGQGQEYVAKGETSIEIFDSTGNSVTRRIAHEEIRRADPLPDSDLTLPPISRSMWFDLKPGKYDCLIEVADLQSARKFRNSTTKFLKDFRKLPVWSDVVVATPDSLQAGLISPLMLGGDAQFGKNFSLYFEIHSAHDTLRKVTVKFFRYEHHPTEKMLTFHDSIPEIALQKTRMGATPDDSASIFQLVPASGGYYSASIPVHGDQIDYGQYMLEVKAFDGEKKIVLGKLMGIRWIGIPHSLLSIDYAIDMLSFELDKNEFDSLKALPREDQIRTFEKYWKAKDPTPGTAYNEALAEYYRRVDYARTAYASVLYPDGAKTDRGKISILFGIPTSPERFFPTDKPPFEVWTYTRLRKRFIFTDDGRNGSYKLVQVEDL